MTKYVNLNVNVYAVSRQNCIEGISSVLEVSCICNCLLSQHTYLVGKNSLDCLLSIYVCIAYTCKHARIAYCLLIKFILSYLMY